ncbi:MAG: dihydrofolate reductase family protein [Chitinophagaceae bacterium]
MRKVILFIATSADGYIAKPNDDLKFLDLVQQEGEDYGYSGFINTIDTVIIGRKTYDWIMAQVPEFVHADKTTYVITRNDRPDNDNTIFYTGDLTALITELKSRQGKNIFIDGGAEVVNELLQHDLIDEFVISLIPVFVGNGTKLFKDGRPEQLLQMVSAKTFDTGLVQLYYKRVRD